MIELLYEASDEKTDDFAKIHRSIYRRTRLLAVIQGNNARNEPKLRIGGSRAY